MRGALAKARQRLGALVGDDANRRVLLDRKRQIDELAVDDTGQRRLREVWRDPLRDVAHASARRDSAGRPVRKRHRDLIHLGLTRSSWLLAVSRQLVAD